MYSVLNNVNLHNGFEVNNNYKTRDCEKVTVCKANTGTYVCARALKYMHVGLPFHAVAYCLQCVILLAVLVRRS